ncbi:MAG: hypothetical protein GPJ07_15740 [Microcystis aeruginosa G13-07]|jgi:hypothetical protein|nr:hypothetical protein [Microcystis aeruginosa G13-07]
MKWTIMIFMAADNDLERRADQDIHEMERFGSTDEVTIVVQVDRRGDTPNKAALRGKIDKNPNWDEFEVKVVSDLEDIGETNTGDPEVLRDFIIFAVTNFPAERYGIVVWSHGSGWKPKFIEEAVNKSVPEILPPLRDAGFAERYADKTRRILFRQTLDGVVDNFIRRYLLPNLGEESVTENINAEKEEVINLFARTKLLEVKDVIIRAIALDETSRDALDSLELNAALKNAATILTTNLGQPFRYAFIGFDACLMAGIETCFELRDLTDLIVGSEDVEPAVGWRYDLLLQKFSDVADSAIDVVKLLVDNYTIGLEDYRIRLVTQSAISTNELEDFAIKIDNLAVLLKKAIDERYIKLAQSEKGATKFFDKDFIDIGDYLERIITQNISDEINQSAQKVREVYNRLIIASKFNFAFNNEKPTGLSIYYPSKEIYDAKYEELSIYKAFGNWTDFIKRYHFLIQ